jgi:hypothetical protein
MAARSMKGILSLTRIGLRTETRLTKVACRKLHIGPKPAGIDLTRMPQTGFGR